MNFTALDGPNWSSDVNWACDIGTKSRLEFFALGAILDTGQVGTTGSPPDDATLSGTSILGHNVGRRQKTDLAKRHDHGVGGRHGHRGVAKASAVRVKVSGPELRKCSTKPGA